MVFVLNEDKVLEKQWHARLTCSQPLMWHVWEDIRLAAGFFVFLTRIVRASSIVAIILLAANTIMDRCILNLNKNTVV